MADEIKVGGVVQLNSGGPKMTVTAVEPDRILCVWFDGTEQKYGAFKRETLSVTSGGPTLA